MPTKSSAEEALRESEERYRQLVELLPDPVIVRVGSTIVFANPAALKAFRAKTPEDVVGQPATRFIPPEGQATAERRIALAMAGEVLPPREHRFLRVDGTEGDAEVTSAPLVFEGQRAVLVVARDVSERRAAERAREAATAAERTADQRARALFHAVPVPMYAWQRVERDGKPDAMLVDYNQAAADITKGVIASFVGNVASNLPGTDTELRERLMETLRDGVIKYLDLDYVYQTGEKKRFAITYIPVPPDVVLLHTEDLTHRVALEEQLRHSQKMEAVGLLAGGVAHDFNNLLTVIQLCAATVRHRLGVESPLDNDVAEIQLAASRAAELTRQLLAFSRKQVLQPRSLDVNAVIVGLHSMLRRVIEEDVVVDLVTAPDLSRALADPGQIEQVITNLVLNARDAMPSGGVLTIATANATLDAAAAQANAVRPGAFVRVSVRDTGHGMDEATRARIFEPFFTTKAPGRGTGLGLSMVYGIVRQSGGTLDVESEPGRGTVFTVLLPADDASVPRSEPITNAAIPPTSTGALILVVEDEPALRAITRRILEGAGHRVVEANDGRHALDVVATLGEKLDLLVTDMIMPGLGGRDLHEALSRTQDLQVLYMSGYTDDEILRRGELAPGSAFLQKPFRVEALRQAVHDILAARLLR